MLLTARLVNFSSPLNLLLTLTLTLTTLSAMLEEVSSEYVLLAVHGIGYLAR
jgi:hypothetical protein